MALYVFSLMVGYISSGVDTAQGIRSEFLRKRKEPVYYIFFDLPGEREISMYEHMGIKKQEMMSMHMFLADNFEYGENIRIKSYHDRERLVLQEYYGGPERVLYRDYFETVRTETKYYAKKVKTSFLDKSGRTAFDCLYGDNGEETYVFPKGDTYSKQQLIEKFMQKLALTENDTVFVDRPSYLDFVQPLFKYKNKAKTVMFFHAGHFFKSEESISSLGLSVDYYYWFRNSDKIDYILVSTEEQKKEVQECLEQFGCVVPCVEAVPAAFLYELKFPAEGRKKHSLLTVSRLVYNKRVEWVVAAAIEAKKQIADLTLDVYGNGDLVYEKQIEQLIAENNASSYIRMMGHRDMRDVYQDYEIYVSASVRESLGLSVMEAVGSGLAVIGLNVRYGNRLFVEPGKNGKLIDFDAELSRDEEAVTKLISELSEAIVALCSDETDLCAYQEHSYVIAKRFLKENVEKRWMELLEKI